MPLTPIYSIPYPALSDAPNGPAQMQALATAAETAIGTQDDRLDVLETNSSRGVDTQTADGTGTIAVVHGLGVTPSVWFGTPANQSTELLNQIVKIIAWTADATHIRFRAFRSDTGVALASNPIKIHWEAYK